MTATAASNSVTPLIATPAPAGARYDTSTARGAVGDHFAQTLQRRMERSESRPAQPQRQSERPAAERPREPGPRAETARPADAAKDAEPAPTAEAAAPAPSEAGAEAPAAESPETAESGEAVPLIAGLPASIAAILQNLAGQRGQSLAAEEGGKGSAPITPFAPPTGDTATDPLQNPGGRWLPAASEGGQQTAAEAKFGELAKGENGFAARLQQTLNTEGALPSGMEAGTVGGVPQSAPPPAASRPPQLPVMTPAGHGAWAEDVGNRVTLLLGRGESKAELVLTPPNLGRLEVSLTVDGDQTTAQFVASTPAARDALEQALPRLREVLQQAGIALGQANVSTSGDQHAQREGSNRGGGNGRDRGRGVGGIEAAGDGTAAPAAWLRRSDGMVDIFA